MAIYKNLIKKEQEDKKDLNVIHEQNEDADMELEGLIPPNPDNIIENQNQAQNIQGNSNSISLPNERIINEDELKRLIEKEEENLAKKKIDKLKSLEEITKGLNSLKVYFNNAEKNLYKESFYDDLKKKISK